MGSDVNSGQNALGFCDAEVGFQTLTHYIQLAWLASFGCHDGLSRMDLLAPCGFNPQADDPLAPAVPGAFL